VNAKLYIVRHQIDGEDFSSPVVGDAELNTYIKTAGHFGARLAKIEDVE
jgi:hypothetical protein